MSTFNTVHISIYSGFGSDAGDMFSSRGADQPFLSLMYWSSVLYNLAYRSKQCWILEVDRTIVIYTLTKTYVQTYVWTYVCTYV